MPFQSTHPCGVRHNPSRVTIGLALFQSTHPCGVRQSERFCGMSRSCFNPRTRVGCDHPFGQQPCQIGFQSTHPCGVRHLRQDYANILPMFQSTHPCGVRHYLQTIATAMTAFQSTHPCGVRPRGNRWFDITSCFNPRTRVGCDQ